MLIRLIDPSNKTVKCNSEIKWNILDQVELKKVAHAVSNTQLLK